jgi:ubiquinone/menaquinone biosynthesis C-methylase UbiE
MEASPMSQAASWDLVASEYEQEIAPVFREFARQTLALVPPGRRAVDVAAGPGTLTFLAAAQGAHVEALDFSPHMIERLAARLAHEPASIEARVGDGMALPYPDATFDAAYSQFGLMFFPDRGRGFGELLRVLAPGGRAAVASWQPLARNEVLFTVVKWAAELAAAAGVPPAPAIPAPLSDAQSCLAELQAAGFRDAQVHELCAYAEFADGRSMIASFLRANLPFVLLKRGLGARFDAIAEQLGARAAQHFGAGPVRVELPALLSVGTR